MRRIFPFKYQLIAKESSLFQWSQERCATGTLVQQRKQIFEKGYGILCDNLERC